LVPLDYLDQPGSIRSEHWELGLVLVVSLGLPVAASGSGPTDAASELWAL
jgi:hypothetical protein